MLTSLRIRNFGSCTDAYISDIGPSLLLVGPNNAGKTTIMNAICWARDVALAGGLVNVDAFFTRSEVELDFSIGNDQYRYRASARASDADRPLEMPYYEESLTALTPNLERNIYVRNGEELISYFSNEPQTYSINRTAPSVTFLTTINPESAKELRDIYAFLRQIRYFALDSVADDDGNWTVVTENELNMFKAGAVQNSEAGNCVIKLVDLWRNKEVLFDELTSLLGRSHLDIINNIAIEEREDFPVRPAKKESTPSKRYLVLFETNGGYAYYQELSFGTKRILHALIAVLYEPNSVMLLEQPEDGIHPGLLTRLTNVLLSYTDPMQLILTSHSSAVINIVGSKNIRIVQAQKGQTQVRALSADELAKAEQYVDATGQLADYVRILED